MTRRVLKTIAAGILLGAALFFMPFIIIQAFVFVILAFAFFRLFAGRRFRRGTFYKYRLAFADDIRNMTEEEYEAFKQTRHVTCDYYHTKKSDQ